MFTPGPLPSSIGRLKNLYGLGLEGDSLTGTVPDSIVHLRNLHNLGLSENNLSGALPNALGDSLSDLSYLNLQNNQFDGLPNLSSITNLQYLYLANNRFGFEDIVPNFSLPSNFITYTPQFDSIGSYRDTTINLGAGIIFSTPAVANNEYQWRKNGVAIDGATGSTYTLSSTTAGDVGSYSCAVTKSLVTGLTYYSRPINLLLLKPGVPNDVQNLVAVPGDKSVMLTWDKNSQDPDVRRYRIYSDINLNPTTQTDSVNYTDTTVTITGLTNGVRYYFRVKALDIENLLSINYSTEKSVIAGDITPPVAPVAVAYAGNNEVKLIWAVNSEPDFTRYTIYRSTTNGFTPSSSDSIAVITQSGGIHNYLDITVTNSTTYYYKIAAVDFVGNKGLSSQLTATPSTSVPTWLQESLPTGATGYGAIAFANPRRGWVGTNDGHIVNTTDGGANWNFQTSPVEGQTTFVEAFFLDSLRGWLAGTGGIIVRTTDGGTNWTSQTSGIAGTIRSVFFLPDGVTGWLSGNAFRKTTDGGANWVTATTPPGGVQRHITFLDANNGWSGRYGSPLFYKTIDGGNNWTLLSNVISQFPNCITRDFQMTSSQIGYASGFDSIGNAWIIKTTDGGTTWQNISPSAYGQVLGIKFLSPTNGWICTTSGYIFHTTNGGQSWDFQSTRSQAAFYSMAVLDSNGLGWAIDYQTSPYKLNLVSSPSQNQGPTISYLSPAQEDSLWGGVPAQIKWSANDDNGIGRVVIEYAADGSTFAQLAQVYNNANRYIWNVPDNEQSVNAKFRITVYDQQGLSASTQSISGARIFPSANYVHNTGAFQATIQNDGSVGTGIYGFNKPSLRFGGIDHEYRGLLWFGYIRGAGDTVSTWNVYNLENYKRLTSITTQDFGDHVQTSTSYRDNVGANLTVQEKTY